MQDKKVQRTPDQRGPGLSQWIIQGDSHTMADISTGCYITQKDSEYSPQNPQVPSVPLLLPSYVGPPLHADVTVRKREEENPSMQP